MLAQLRQQLAEQEQGIVGGIANVSDVDKSPTIGVDQSQLFTAQAHQVADGIESAVIIVMCAKAIGVYDVTQLIKRHRDA
ncbi:hypothetical protein D3C77_768320 [compost metagenome]